MLLKSHIEELLAMTAGTLSRIARDSGYKDARFDTCEFVGITNSGDFAYTATYKEDGVEHLTKLYVWRNAAGQYIAEF